MNMRLSDVCEFIIDCEHKTAPLSDSGYPSIRTPNVGRGRLILRGVNRVSEQIYAAWTKRGRPQANDIIIAREAPVGNAAIIRPGQLVCLGQRTVLVRPDPKKVVPDFLVYFLLGDYAQDRFRAVAQGATVPHLNMKDIRELPLPVLPKFSIQKRVAEILCAYDDLIDVNDRRTRILQEVDTRLFDEWFVARRYPGADETCTERASSAPGNFSWPSTRLGELLTLEYGKALRADDRRNGQVAVYGSSGQVGVHDEALVQGPGIIVGRKGNVGSVFLSAHDFFPIDTVFYVKSTLPMTWLYQVLRRQNFFSSDAAVPGLNRNQAHSIEVVQPPTELIVKYAKIAEPIHAQIEALKKASTHLGIIRDRLLPKLIAGDIDVRAATMAMEAA